MIKRKFTSLATPIAQILPLLRVKRRPALSPSLSNKTRSSHSWMGFRGKTLWDWLGVILIPVILAIYAMDSSAQQTALMEQQNRIADEQLKSGILRDYTHTIQDLILDKGLLQSKPNENIRVLAKTQTTHALEQLDAKRKARLLLFIYQLELIDTQNPIINLSRANISNALLMRSDLSHANLSEINLSGAYLGDANLNSADLNGASLFYASLSRANFSRANLSGADLRNASLRGTNLEGANLTGAKVTDEQLKQAASLRRATMPDGSIHP